MSPWERMLDNWCLNNAGMNLIAFKQADFISDRLRRKFVDFVIKAVPEGAKHFTKQQIEDGLYKHTTMHRRCCRDSAESLFAEEIPK